MSRVTDEQLDRVTETLQRIDRAVDSFHRDVHEALSDTDTRRERIATAALQGLLASGFDPAGDAFSEHARWSVRMADALIAELDRPPKGGRQ